VKALAAIPSREVLISQVAGLLKSPVQRFAAVMAALAAKKGEGAAPAVEAVVEAPPESPPAAPAEAAPAA
jgi:large subunit ribosomal protein L10